MTVPMFSQADDGNTRLLKRSTTFALELKEMPTTGYRWHLEFSKELILLSSDLALAECAPPGAGGVRRWVFQADHAGEFSIQGKLWREWQGDDSVSLRYRLTVRVA